VDSNGGGVRWNGGEKKMPKEREKKPQRRMGVGEDEGSLQCVFIVGAEKVQRGIRRGFVEDPGR